MRIMQMRDEVTHHEEGGVVWGVSAKRQEGREGCKNDVRWEQGTPSELVERKKEHLGSEINSPVNMVAGIWSSFLIALVFLRRQTARSSAESGEGGTVGGLGREEETVSGGLRQWVDGRRKCTEAEQTEQRPAWSWWWWTRRGLLAVCTACIFLLPVNLCRRQEVWTRSERSQFCQANPFTQWRENESREVRLYRRVHRHRAGSLSCQIGRTEGIRGLRNIAWRDWFLH